MNDGLDNFTYDELSMIRDVFQAKLDAAKTHIFRGDYRQIVEKCDVQMRDLDGDPDA